MTIWARTWSVPSYTLEALKSLILTKHFFFQECYQVICNIRLWTDIGTHIMPPPVPSLMRIPWTLQHQVNVPKMKIFFTHNDHYVWILLFVFNCRLLMGCQIFTFVLSQGYRCGRIIITSLSNLLIEHIIIKNFIVL